MRKHFAALPIAGLLLLGAAAPSFAAGNNKHEGQNAEMRERDALANTNLTLSQAIATAEQQTGGKAYDAGADVDTGTPRVVVETNGPKGVQTVTIDAQSGKVVGTHSGGETD
jgi:uncharacterized membrane protein YkoI